MEVQNQQYNRLFIVLIKTKELFSPKHDCSLTGGETWPHPIPFIKSCIMSKRSSVNDINIFYVDSVINKGFSGGPLLFKHSETGNIQIAAVCVAHKNDRQHILLKDEKGNRTPLPEESQHYSDMSVAHPVDYIKDIIMQNPVGTVISN